MAYRVLGREDLICDGGVDEDGNSVSLLDSC